MIIRTIFIGLAAVVLPVSSANAQGRPQPKVVLSGAVLKSMAANKPKSKTPFTARLKLVPRSSILTTKPVQVAPTSVGEIGPFRKN